MSEALPSTSGTVPSALFQNAAITQNIKAAKGQAKGTDHHPILTHQFKANLIEYAVKSGRISSPSEKASTRNINKLIIRDTKAISSEKQRRTQEVQHAGFLSVAKEPYHPLGDPVLGTEELILGALNVGKQTISKTSQFKNKIQNENNDAEVAEEHIAFDLQVQPSNGYNIIKEELRKSKNRWHSVKFGVPFESAVKHQENDSRSVAKTFMQEKNNWPKIDPDKQSYFKNLVETHKRQQRIDREKESQQNEDRNNTQKIEKLKTTRQDSEALSKEEIEFELNIPAKTYTVNPLKAFLSEREKIYERRQLLTYTLEEEMRRLENDRKAQFKRREENLHYDDKRLFVDVIHQMRRKAMEAKTKDRRKILQSHPWYKEMMDKIVLTNKHEGLGEIEEAMIEFIQGLVEDQVPFTKDVFVRLMRLVPKKEFSQDNIQRILRFIKQHEAINERDYLDAIEHAGHSVV